jgi:hypothetical protein
MSMPRDDSCTPRPVARHRRRQASSSARFIGRVGGLAVALGIGAAVANSPGIAAADTTGSDSSSDAGPSDASAGSGATNGSPSTSPPSASDVETTDAETKDVGTKDVGTKDVGTKDTDTTSAESKADKSHPPTSVTAQTNRGTTASSDTSAASAESARSLDAGQERGRRGQRSRGIATRAGVSAHAGRGRGSRPRTDGRYRDTCRPGDSSAIPGLVGNAGVGAPGDRERPRRLRRRTRPV